MKELSGLIERLVPTFVEVFTKRADDADKKANQLGSATDTKERIAAYRAEADRLRQLAADFRSVLPNE